MTPVNLHALSTSHQRHRTQTITTQFSVSQAVVSTVNPSLHLPPTHQKSASNSQTAHPSFHPPSFPAFCIKQKTHLLKTLTIGAQTTIPFLCFLCPFTSQSNCTNSCNLHLFSWCWFSGLRSLPEGRIFVFASRSAGWKGEIEGGIF